ncbi:MAG: outer membrane lipoprotein-sorting protein [Flavobacteriales bacterium]|nr:outer membrane lipoprotein-sorting protein [Flavobacteriales bacterium]
MFARKSKLPLLIPFLPLLAVFLLFVKGGAQDNDASDIIRKAEDRMRGKTSISTMRISIVRPKWTRDMVLKNWTRGENYSLSLITEPARDKGTVFLRRDKEVWNWVPSVERVIKLPPSMMSQSWMGTDLTNDDLVKQSDMKSDFTHTLLGKEMSGGVNCYKIRSVPREEAAVVWGKIVHWISVEDYIQMKAEFYDEDGYLVNTFVADKIQMMGGKKIASRLEILPAEKNGHKTILEYLSLEFDAPLSEDFFTTQNMKRVK